MRAAWCALAIAVALPGCRSCHEHSDSDRDVDEGEDRDEARESYWRPQIVIVGAGKVATADASFDCMSDGTRQSGECGPKLVRFGELNPPLLIATPALGWKFEHWESLLHEPDGSTRAHSTAAADQPRYMNAFGYSDTGELEEVTAVFVAVAAGSPSR